MSTITLTTAILLTIIIETIVYYSYFKNTKAIQYGILINLISVPLLWQFLKFFSNLSYSIFIGEIIVLITEAIAIKKIFKTSCLKALEISALANLFSYSLGIILHFL